MFLLCNNILTARTASCRTTTSGLITAISAVSIPITAVKDADTLTIAALKCSTLTENCVNASSM